MISKRMVSDIRASLKRNLSQILGIICYYRQGCGLIETSELINHAGKRLICSPSLLNRNMHYTDVFYMAHRHLWFSGSIITVDIGIQIT